MSEHTAHEDADATEFAPRLSLRQEWGRKSFHVAGVVLPAGYVLVGPERAAACLLGLTALVVTADLLRLHWGFARRVYRATFARWSRGDEAHRLTGASMFIIAQTVTALIFPRCVAPVAMMFGALGDPAAALAGKRFGRYQWRRGKSLCGSAACLLASFVGGIACTGIACTGMQGSLAGLGLSSSPCIAWWVVLPGAVAATLAEGLSGRVNDNLTIPIAGGLAMWAVAALSA